MFILLSSKKPVIVPPHLQKHAHTNDSIFERYYPAFNKGVRGGRAFQLWCSKVGIWLGVILTIWTFFKAQNSILYTLIISWKVSMTFKYQEYSIKMNMVQQLWTQFKMKFLLSYNMELVM